MAEVARRRTPLNFLAGTECSKSVLLAFYRAGLPVTRAPTVWAVPPVQSCTRAAAMDAVIRNPKDGGGMTKDGGSARGSANARR